MSPLTPYPTGTQPQQLELGLSKEGPTWKDLLGANNWEGLLDPLNDELRHLILRCGDFCQVTYDSFIGDANNKYHGASRFAKHDLLEKTVFPGGPQRYDVVGFLYATAVAITSVESNWIGYVAVTNDEESKKIGRREVYVAWRGTQTTDEWLDVFEPQLVSAKPLLRQRVTSTPGNDNVDDEEPKVMFGWLTIYNSKNEDSQFTKTSARTQLLNILKKIIDEYEDETLSITFAGHSLGASLAILSIFDVAENLITNTTIPTTAFVFGCPHIGNNAFKEKLDSHPNVKILHIRNEIDLIPHYPFKIMGYEDIGVELVINTWKSPYLKKSMNPGDWHNLQGILHVVNGWHGLTRDFNLIITRCLPLVNKSCDLLLPDYGIPPNWWVEKNRGMLLNGDGQWIMSRLEGYPEFILE